MRAPWVLSVACLGIACSAARPRLRQTEGAALQRPQDVLRCLRCDLSGVSGELGCSPSDKDAPPAGAWLIMLSVGALRLSPRLRRPRSARR